MVHLGRTLSVPQAHLCEVGAWLRRAQDTCHDVALPWLKRDPAEGPVRSSPRAGQGNGCTPHTDEWSNEEWLLAGRRD